MSSAPPSAAASLSRSVYISRLRRAFLLKIHPDRFRNHSANTRSKQASLVKALTDRLSQPDFIEWQQQRNHTNNNYHHYSFSSSYNNQYPYIVERKDGTYMKTSIELNESVEHILHSIKRTLQKSGIASSSLPVLPNDDGGGGFAQPVTGAPQFAQQPNGYAGDTAFNNNRSTSWQQHNHPIIDHRYNVQSNHGRDLFHFLQTLSTESMKNEIQQRRLYRMDAQSAAMEVRRVYQFQSVDATTLGWSSESVAVLLNQLLAFYEEHSNKFNVSKTKKKKQQTQNSSSSSSSSFYPATLLFTNDDHRNVLDIYGGVLRLNPAMTPLQWLEHRLRRARRGGRRRRSRRR